MAALAWLGLMAPLLSAAAWSCEWQPDAAIDTAANRQGIIHLSVFMCNLLEVSEMRARPKLAAGQVKEPGGGGRRRGGVDLGEAFGAGAAGAGAAGGEATAAGQAQLRRAEVPATGRQETILSIERFGRYSVRAASRQGTAVRVIDRMAGELGAAGEAGHENGRLDLFLDRGDHQVVTGSHVHGAGPAEPAGEPVRHS